MITGIITTLNEEKNITDCINSLKSVCSEIIVVDSLSEDKTTIQAKELGAIIVEQEYLGDGPQRNFGLESSSNTWVLSLDADERLTDEAIIQIKELQLSVTKHDAFAFRRRSFIGSRWVTSCGWYPDYKARLFNKNKTRFPDRLEHSSCVPAKNLKKLNADILHYRYDNIGQLFAKNARDYSGRGAKILYKKGKRATPFSPILHGMSSFLSKYFIKKGFLEGVDGLSLALSIGVNSYVKYAKLLEFQRDPSVLKKENFEKVW